MGRTQTVALPLILFLYYVDRSHDKPLTLTAKMTNRLCTYPLLMDSQEIRPPTALFFFSLTHFVDCLNKKKVRIRVLIRF